MRRVYFLKPFSSKSLFFRSRPYFQKCIKYKYIIFLLVSILTSQLFIRGLLRSHVPTARTGFPLSTRRQSFLSVTEGAAQNATRHDDHDKPNEIQKQVAAGSNTNGHLFYLSTANVKGGSVSECTLILSRLCKECTKSAFCFRWVPAALMLSFSCIIARHVFRNETRHGVQSDRWAVSRSRLLSSIGVYFIGTSESAVFRLRNPDMKHKVYVLCVKCRLCLIEKSPT